MIYWLVGYVLLSVFTYYFVLWAMMQLVRDALEGNLEEPLISLIEQDKLRGFLISVAVLSPIIWTATIILMAYQVIKTVVEGVISLFKGEQV